MWQGQEHDEQMEDYDDYDEEPVFILTDEWREFFAQSEAKRKKGSILTPLPPKVI